VNRSFTLTITTQYTSPSHRLYAISIIPPDIFDIHATRIKKLALRTDLNVPCE